MTKDVLVEKMWGLENEPIPFTVYIVVRVMPVQIKADK